MSAENEIARIADYILTNYPHEIGTVDSVYVESAVDVTIRLLERSRKLEEKLESEEYGFMLVGWGQDG